jgi:dipeptidyl aminopeptidase/acylaminoacyl peptidase
MNLQFGQARRLGACLLLIALSRGSMANAQGVASAPLASPLEDEAESQDSPQGRSRRGPQRGVYKASIAANWFDDGTRFWYRNDLRGDGREFILVNAAKGERRRAFDHERLAKALGEAGVTSVRADRLAIDALEFDTAAGTMSFRAGGKDWRCNLESYELKPIAERRPPRDGTRAATEPQDVPRASTRTGPETELRFVNRTDGAVELFWLDASGERRSYGVVAAGAERAQHTFAGHVWLAVDTNGRTVAAFEADERPGDAVITGRDIAPQSRSRRPRLPSSFGAGVSPDGKWRALVRDGNVFVRDGGDENAKEFQLTQGGTSEIGYERPEWAPDSQTLVTMRVEPGERKEVFLIESSPRDGGRAVLHQRPYALPGDKFTSYELNLFRLDQAAAPQGGDSEKPGIGAWEGIKLDLDRVDFGRPRVRWSRDGSTFSYTKVDRGHQRLRVVEVDARTAKSRNIVDEQTDTFIWTAHTENFNIPPVTWLEKTDELIYVSEVDGWRHLFLIDPAAKPADETAEPAPQVAHGAKRLFAPGLKNQITKGPWVIRGIDRIDEESRQVWFRASGMNADQDPYLVHYCRVNFDGTGLVQLTAGNGNHSIQFSPDRRHIIDTYSRVDAPPIHELRRVDDGSLVCPLEDADVSELREAGWTPPEVFSAKGRDGTTDIWGIICRPRDFDPAKKYPVIEDIYAGPQGSFVPKTFSSRGRYETLNDLGFIVVKIDGMGTANRSKAFHDVCWHNLKDAGFPDRILWMKAAAAKYPQMDLGRVGVYGGSAGGQNAAGAVLFHPDFYKVAVAGCGCHDNRMDKASWNEQWMGYPVGPQYAASSNIDNAHRLQGKLLLIVGEMDTNVPPESTMRLADALIKADKDFDLVVVPGAGHGMGGAYGQRRMHDFFVRHLLGDASPQRAAVGVTEPLASPAISDERPDPARPATRATAPAAQAARTLEAAPRTDSGAGSRVAAASDIPPVTAPPDTFFEMVGERDRDAARKFYQKYIDVRGMPVVAAGEVADEALQRTHSIVTGMLAGRPDIVGAMVTNRMYLIIIGKDQVYTDMPEYRNSRNPDYMNERVRGTGGRPTSFGEENVLGWPVDRYDDESIGVHEFCHTIDGALRSLDPTWNERKNRVFQNAMAKGLWKNTYAASNPGEYWAEIAQCYFDCQRVNNWNHGPIGTREQLKEYDPEAYELVRTTFNLGPGQDWRYRPARRLPAVTAPPARLRIDPYYTKFTWAREFTVLGRAASDESLLAANNTIRKMFAYRHDVLKALIADGVRLVVLGRDESLADLPEFAGVGGSGDLLARVFDYKPDSKLLVVGEENVLGNVKDPLVAHNQVIRVLAQAIYHVAGTRPVDPNWDNRPRGVWQQYELGVERLDVRFDQKLAELYDAATSAGKWRGTAAARDRVAYWAAGVLAYFDAGGRDAAPHDAPHPIATREALRDYDPDLAALVHKTMAFGGRADWRLGKR